MINDIVKWLTVPIRLINVQWMVGGAELMYQSSVNALVSAPIRADVRADCCFIDYVSQIEKQCGY